MAEQSVTTASFGNAVKDFQLTSDVKSKSDIAFGKKIAEQIQATLGGNTSYYYIRNNRFAINRSMVNGRYDMSRFMDRLQMNAKFNYVNINWLPFHLVNTIISRKVGAWMERNEKIDVSAIDVGSELAKKRKYEEALMFLDQKEKMQKLQEESGQQIIPQNLPQDVDELDIWATENNRLPEEIKYETGTNGILEQEGLFDVVKEKLLHDSASVGLVGLYTWMDEKGQIHDEYVRPENSIYSYSEFPDLRDTTWRGRVMSRKISWIRKKYSVEFGGTMSEEDIFQLAQTAKEYQVPDKIRWLSEWSTSLLRPYDEWNIDTIEFAFKSLESDGYNMKVTKSGTLIMDRGKNNLKSQPTYSDYIPDDGWNMYWGVFAREATKMLEWGLMKNQIKSQDIKELGNVEFPFSFYMYQNQDMRNVAIPEKIEKPFEQMTLILLQMEKLITTWKPPGSMVNVNAVRELDLGTANLYKPLDLEKHHRQTGTLYYTDTDAEGNKIGTPITEIANAGFRENALGLREQYLFWYQSLKDELGEDPNLVSQALQPRVTEGNIQTSQQLADNATDYMYNAYQYVIEEAARKTACLMHDSVSFGASTYRHIIGEDDVKDRIFATKVRLLPNDREIIDLQAQINQAIASNPDLVMYMNTFKIMRIAKEDIKLAEEYFRLGMKRMIQGKAAQVQQNATLNAKAQQESLAMKADFDMKELEKKLKIEGLAQTEQSKNKLREIALQGYFQVMSSKNGDVQPEAMPVINEMLQNLMLPLFKDNAEHTMALGALLGNPEQQGQQDEGQQPSMQDGQQQDQSQQQQIQPPQPAAA
jgi:hypothetical protein